MRRGELDDLRLGSGALERLGGPLLLSLLGGLVALGFGCSGGNEPDADGAGSGAAPGAGGRMNSGGAASAGGAKNGSGSAESGGTPSDSGGTDPGGPGPSSDGSAGSMQDPAECRADGDGKTTLTFVNRCDRSVSFRGSDIDGGELAPGAVTCVDIGSDIEPINSKRYWGFVGEDPGGERHTLAEFTFNTDFYDFDWYNISHVDAHNLSLQIVPVARDCEILTCAMDFLESCPEEGRFAGKNGEIIACVSPDRDNPESPVAQYFEACDEAYAWSGDDQEGDDPSPMRACAGEDWDIVFCPEPEP